MHHVGTVENVDMKKLNCIQFIRRKTSKMLFVLLAAWWLLSYRNEVIEGPWNLYLFHFHNWKKYPQASTVV